MKKNRRDVANNFLFIAVVYFLEESESNVAFYNKRRMMFFYFTIKIKVLVDVPFSSIIAK